MTNGEPGRSQVDNTSEIKPMISRNTQRRRKGSWTTGKVLAWVGAVATVIGTLVALEDIVAELLRDKGSGCILHHTLVTVAAT